MKHTVFISAKVGYKGNMPVNGVKKSEQVLINLSPEVHALVTQIALNEDRPLGYVARELMQRGLNLYGKDGLLRDQQLPEISAAAQRKIQGNIRPSTDSEIKRVPHLGKLTNETANKQKPIKKKAGGTR
jgi:hypothetical protein